MENIEQYKKRFYNLMESTMGDVKPLINEASPDPQRVKYFNGLAQKIASKIIGKTFVYGKIGVFDNASIIVQKYVDRNHAINSPGYPVNEFVLYFDVKRKEEDLYPNEKTGSRIWIGTLRIEAKYLNGSLSGNPDVSVYPGQGDNINFSIDDKPSKPFTWDMVGGVDLWSQATKI